MCPVCGMDMQDGTCPNCGWDSGRPMGCRIYPRQNGKTTIANAANARMAGAGAVART